MGQGFVGAGCLVEESIFALVKPKGAPSYIACIEKRLAATKPGQHLLIEWGSGTDLSALADRTLQSDEQCQARFWFHSGDGLRINVREGVAVIDDLRLCIRCELSNPGEDNREVLLTAGALEFRFSDGSADCDAGRRAAPHLPGQRRSQDLTCIADVISQTTAAKNLEYYLKEFKIAPRP